MSLWDVVESDLPIFFDTDGFGKSALLKGTTNIVIQFFNGYENAIREDGGIASSEPRAAVKSSDVLGVVQGDTLLVEGITYTIADIEPEGPGGVTVLKLSR